MNNFNIPQNIKKVVAFLFDHDESLLHSYFQNDSMKPEYIFQEIKEYPGQLTFPPEIAFSDYEELPIDCNNIIVWFNLWFDDRKSDLIFEMRLTKDEKNNIQINVQGLRVM